MKIDSLLLAVPAVLFLLALVSLLSGREKNRRWVFLPAVVSCHLATAALLWFGGITRPVLRTELRALEASLEDAEGAPLRVTVGGASGRDGGKADSIYVPDYPAEAFVFQRDDQKQWHLRPGPGWRPELIVWSGNRPVMMQGKLPTVVPLFSGDKLRMKTTANVAPPMKAAAARVVEVSYLEQNPWKHSARLELAEGGGWTLPNRKIEIPVLSWEVSLLRRQPWQQRVYPLEESGLMPGVKSVIFHGMEHPQALGAHLLLLDPGLSVQSVETSHRDESWVGLQSGAAHLRLDELLPAVGGRAARLLTRRAFQSLEILPARSHQPACVRLVLERPQVFSKPMQKLRMPGHEGGVRRLFLNDLMVTKSAGPRFSKLSARHDQANAELREENGSWIIRDDLGERPLRWSQPFLLGLDHRLEIVAQEVAVPWRLIGPTLLGAALSMLAFFAMPKRGFMGALFFGLSALAGIRLVCAYAAWVNPPHDPGVVTVAVHVIWLLPLVLALLWLCLPRLGMKLRHWLAEARQGWSYPALITLALFLLGARVLLALAGFKEALPLPGFRLALSLFFVPAHLVLFALALCRLQADRCHATADAFSVLSRFLLFTFLVFFPAQLVAGVFVSDLGALLYLLPPTLVLAAQGAGILYTEVRGWIQSRSAHAEPRVMALLGGLVFLFPAAGLMSVVAHPMDVVRVFPEVRAALDDPGHVITESNLLRLMQFVDEKTLSSIGTDEAQRIGQDHALMRTYARRGLLGEGYLDVPVVHAKRETALNDNVFAVYVLAQFGVVGGAFVLLAYLAVLLAGVSDTSPCPMCRHTALLAGLALTLTSFYMMGANSGLLPFTGRNLYLLGLNSLGDVAETLVLIALLIAGATLRPTVKDEAALA